MFMDNEVLSFIRDFIGTYSGPETTTRNKDGKSRDLSNEENCYIENEDFQHITQKLLYQKWRNTNEKEKKKSKGWAVLTLKMPHCLQLFEWVHFTVSDKMACLQWAILPGQEKPFTFLQHEGYVVCFPAASFAALSQHPWSPAAHSPLGLGQDTSNNPAVPSTAWSSYHIPDCLFPPLCPSLPPILHAISACLCWATFYSSNPQKYL